MGSDVHHVARPKGAVDRAPRTALDLAMARAPHQHQRGPGLRYCQEPGTMLWTQVVVKKCFAEPRPGSCRLGSWGQRGPENSFWELRPAGAARRARPAARFLHNDMWDAFQSFGALAKIGVDVQLACPRHPCRAEAIAMGWFTLPWAFAECLNCRRVLGVAEGRSSTRLSGPTLATRLAEDLRILRASS